MSNWQCALACQLFSNDSNNIETKGRTAINAELRSFSLFDYSFRQNKTKRDETLQNGEIILVEAELARSETMKTTQRWKTRKMFRKQERSVVVRLRGIYSRILTSDMWFVSISVRSDVWKNDYCEWLFDELPVFSCVDNDLFAWFFAI